MANAMLVVAWHLLTNGTLYEDPEADYFVKQHDARIEAKRIPRRIEALGYEVTISSDVAQLTNLIRLNNVEVRLYRLSDSSRHPRQVVFHPSVRESGVGVG